VTRWMYRLKSEIWTAFPGNALDLAESFLRKYRRFGVCIGYTYEITFP